LFVVILFLNRIELSRFNPTACQKVMCGSPKMVGINQFQSNQSGPPISNANPTAIKNANDAAANMFIILSIMCDIKVGVGFHYNQCNGINEFCSLRFNSLKYEF
jgi:hypothetical protein